MMTALLLYGYCNGGYSSRRIAKACRERVDFISIVGLDPPDFRTISEFRKRHLNALWGFSARCCGFASGLGWSELGHVALDEREDQSQRLQAQSDELRADGQAG